MNGFFANRLSLNVKKTKYVLFHEVPKCQCGILPRCSWQLWHLITLKLKQKILSNFLAFIIDENLTWKNHIGVSDSLDFKNLLKIHSSFLHIYISFANIAWTSTFKTKLKGILKKQKHGVRIPFHANRSDCSRPLLKVMKALNIYEINLIQTLKLMRKTKH